MYSNVQITQEMLSAFCESANTDFIKMKEDAKLKNEMIAKLNEQIAAIDLKIETSKILFNEKNENIIYRMSVLTEKMNAIEQKIIDLNKIMMKHFAYKYKTEYKTDYKTEYKNVAVNQPPIQPAVNQPAQLAPLVQPAQPFQPFTGFKQNV